MVHRTVPSSACWTVKGARRSDAYEVAGTLLAEINSLAFAYLPTSCRSPLHPPYALVTGKLHRYIAYLPAYLIHGSRVM